MGGLLLVVLLALAAAVSAQECSDAGTSYLNGHYTASLDPSAGVDYRCYKYDVPVSTPNVILRLEPCAGPLPVFYLGTTAATSSLTFDVSSEGRAVDGYGAVAVELVAAGTFYVFVSRQSGLAGGEASTFNLVAQAELCDDTCSLAANGDCEDGNGVLGIVGAACTIGTDCSDCGTRSGSLPALVRDPTVQAIEKDAREVTLLFERATHQWQDAETLEYAVFRRTHGGMIAAVTVGNVDDDETAIGADQDYFLLNQCSLSNNADLVRNWAVLSNETYVGDSQAQLTMDELVPGYGYTFFVAVRSRYQTSIVYDPADVTMLPADMLYLQLLAGYAIALIVTVLVFFILRARASSARSSMLVTDDRVLSKNAVPSDLEGMSFILPQAITADLDFQETIFWADRPDYAAMMALPFKCFLFLSLVCLLVLLIVGWLFPLTVYSPVVFYSYFGVGALAIVLFFFNMWRPASTVYALTNARAIIYERSFLCLSASLRSLELRAMRAGDIRTEFNPDESGSVYFDTAYSWTICKRHPIGFRYITSAVRCYRHIRHFRADYYEANLRETEEYW